MNLLKLIGMMLVGASAADVRFKHADSGYCLSAPGFLGDPILLIINDKCHDAVSKWSYNNGLLENYEHEGYCLWAKDLHHNTPLSMKKCDKHDKMQLWQTNVHKHLYLREYPHITAVPSGSSGDIGDKVFLRKPSGSHWAWETILA